MIKEKILKIAWMLGKPIMKTYMLSLFIIICINYSGVENEFTDVIKIICYIHVCIGVIMTICGLFYIRSTIKMLRIDKHQWELENYAKITELIESFKKLVDSNSSFYEAQREYVKIRRLLDDPSFFLDESKVNEIMPIFDELTSRMIKLESGKQ